MNDHHDSGIYDLGLAADLSMWNRTPVERRRVLQLGLAAAATFLTGCANGQGQSVGQLPAESAGPFAADGARGVNVLQRSGIIRSDITTSLETGTKAEGIPLNIDLQLLEAGSENVPLVGYAVYLWQCDRETRYSLYSDGVTNEDYLRGVQATDQEGKLRFASIFPGCYAGRWPHLHFEVYASLDAATEADNSLLTSQLAFPEAACVAAYGAAGYEQSVQNLSQVSLESDGAFRDSAENQVANVTGSAEEGYTASFTFGV